MGFVYCKFVKENKNEIGKIFGRLKVMKFVYKNNHYDKYYLCKCECGKEKIICINHLKNGHTKSCGCFRRELGIIKNKTHGLSNTRFYKIWKVMLGRTTNHLKYYEKINICKRWLNFENFRDDMYESYLKHCEEFGEKQTTIGRINNNGNYFNENCRWETYKEQANNKRNNHFLKFNGKTKTISEWGNELDITGKTISKRLIRGWSIEKTLNTPNLRK